MLLLPTYLHTYIQSAETTGYSVTTNNLTKVPEVTVCVLYLFIEMRSFPYSYFISRSVECIKRTQKETQTHTCIHGYRHSWGGGKDSTVSGSLAGYWPINLDNIIGRCKTPIKLMCRLPWSQPIVLMSLIRALRKRTIRYGEKFSKLPLHITTIQGRVFLRKTV